MKNYILKRMITAGILMIFLICFAFNSFADQNDFAWEYDEATKTLTVTGRSIPDFASEGADDSDIVTPWINYLSEIENIVITDGIEYIGSFAFWNCTAVKNISIPDSVKEMGIFVFSKCSALESVDIGKGLEIIPGGTFYSCTSLKYVGFSEGVKKIGVLAFFDCCSLQKIVLPDSLISLGGFSFFRCTSLAEIEFNGSFEEVESDSFLGTAWFYDNRSEWITLGDAAIGYQGKINEKKSLLSFEEGIKVIAGGFNAFDVYGVKRIVIPRSVKYIGELTFASNSFQDTGDVFYQGTEEEWNEIRILEPNFFLTNAAIHFIDKPFSDVSSDEWYAEPAVYCCMNGIICGTAKNVFSPETDLTRAMVATILASYDGVKTDNSSSVFGDVPVDQWYTGAAEWANANGIMNGRGGGIFDPNAPITREEMMTVLGRYAQYKGCLLNDVSASLFADDENISAWARECVMLMKANGIVEGKGGNHFAPKDKATRAEASQILYNYISLIES